MQCFMPFGAKTLRFMCSIYTRRILDLQLFTSICADSLFLMRMSEPVKAGTHWLLYNTICLNKSCGLFCHYFSITKSVKRSGVDSHCAVHLHCCSVRWNEPWLQPNILVHVRKFKKLRESVISCCFLYLYFDAFVKHSKTIFFPHWYSEVFVCIVLIK